MTIRLILFRCSHLLFYTDLKAGLCDVLRSLFFPSLLYFPLSFSSHRNHISFHHMLLSSSYSLFSSHSPFALVLQHEFPISIALFFRIPFLPFPVPLFAMVIGALLLLLFNPRAPFPSDVIRCYLIFATFIPSL